ncbi:ribonuclease HIII [Candidatus Methylacidithermus pantelleriae]|uniref:ribonuclease HIII n=1 Tax=Candidatus Methylacidithermus pantelleriae TaxID=2744239 RepID=UPI00157DF050|nr:ribonuclease HIII [Candidatus Methylacidithermus pantelleriae]
MTNSSYTVRLSREEIEQLRHHLEQKDFLFEPLAHGYFRARKGTLHISAYHSGAVVVQGKGTNDFVSFVLEPEILGEARLGYEEELFPEWFEPHIGVDECGKGDFFGPLVVCAVYLERDSAKRLLAQGLRDSKRVKSAREIRRIARAIREELRGAFSTVTLGPPRYNALYRRFGNLNRMLAWAHAKAVEEVLRKLATTPSFVLLDQFSPHAASWVSRFLTKLEVPLRQKTHAEEDPAVAAASILARAVFLEKLAELGQKAGRELPKGSSGRVREVAKELAERLGKEGLAQLGKIHFTIFQELCSPTPSSPEIPSSGKENP